MDILPQYLPEGVAQKCGVPRFSPCPGTKSHPIRASPLRVETPLWLVRVDGGVGGRNCIEWGAQVLPRTSASLAHPPAVSTALLPTSEEEPGVWEVGEPAQSCRLGVGETGTCPQSP